MLHHVRQCWCIQLYRCVLSLDLLCTVYVPHPPCIDKPSHNPLNAPENIETVITCKKICFNLYFCQKFRIYLHKLKITVLFVAVYLFVIIVTAKYIGSFNICVYIFFVVHILQSIYLKISSLHKILYSTT